MSEKDIEASRPVDTLVMAADLLELGSRRPDLSEAQRSELYFAALSRFRDFPGIDTGLAQPWEIFSWIDIVSPREGHVPSQVEILQEEFIRALIGVDPDRLLLGRDPSTTAAPLAALALKRPDLSILQRHELLMAARRHLGRRNSGPRVESAQDAIFAWIDVVVPVRKRPGPTEGTFAVFRANDPMPEFEPPARKVDRYRLPGWSDLDESIYKAKHPRHHPPRRAGRPKGPYLIQTRAEIEKAYRELWKQQGRRPYWTQVAQALGVDERTLRGARKDFGMGKRPIEQEPE